VHRAHAQSLQRHMIKGARIAISHALNESLAPPSIKNAKILMDGLICFGSRMSLSRNSSRSICLSTLAAHSAISEEMSRRSLREFWLPQNRVLAIGKPGLNRSGGPIDTTFDADPR
jgi:hypothetical protein